MNIVKNTEIRKKFHSGFVRSKPIKWLVVHGTAGGGTLNWVQSAKNGDARYRNYKRGIALFHYLIERDGMITEIIDPDRWVYHASIGQLDHGTIGVELLNPTPDNSGDYTVEQYDSLANLYKYLNQDRGYREMRTILSHNRCKQKVSGGSKVCPGPNFIWRLLCDFVEDQGYDIKHDPEYESIWDIR